MVSVISLVLMAMELIFLPSLLPREPNSRQIAASSTGHKVLIFQTLGKLKPSIDNW